MVHGAAHLTQRRARLPGDHPWPADRTSPFAPRGTPARSRAGLPFLPKFDADGLIPAIVTDADPGRGADVGLDERRGPAPHARDAAWRISGAARGPALAEGRGERQPLRVSEMRTDCDQDAIWLKAAVAGRRRRLPHRRTLLLLPPRPARARPLRPTAARARLTISLTVRMPMRGVARTRCRRRWHASQPAVNPCVAHT